MRRNDSIRSRSAARFTAVATALVIACLLGVGLASAEDQAAKAKDQAANAGAPAAGKYRQLLAGIELSDDQKASIDRIEEENREGHQKRREEAVAMRKKILEAKNAGNEAEADALKAQFRQSANASGRIDQIRAVLNEEQQAQLDLNLERMKKAREQKSAERAAKRKAAQ